MCASQLVSTVARSSHPIRRNLQSLSTSAKPTLALTSCLHDHHFQLGCQTQPQTYTRMTGSEHRGIGPAYFLLLPRFRQFVDARHVLPTPTCTCPFCQQRPYTGHDLSNLPAVASIRDDSESIHRTGDEHMDNVTLIRMIAGVCFVVCLIVLIQRRKKRVGA